MRTRAVWLPTAVAVVAASLAACGRGNGAADCKAVGAAYAALLRQEIKRDPPGATTQAQRQKATSLIPLLKEEMTSECKRQKWSVATRQCIAEAHSQQELSRCDTHPSPPAPPASGNGAGAGTAKGAGTGTGTAGSGTGGAGAPGGPTAPPGTAPRPASPGSPAAHPPSAP